MNTRIIAYGHHEESYAGVMINESFDSLSKSGERIVDLLTENWMSLINKKDKIVVLVTTFIEKLDPAVLAMSPEMSLCDPSDSLNSVEILTTTIDKTIDDLRILHKLKYIIMDMQEALENRQILFGFEPDEIKTILFKFNGSASIMIEIMNGLFHDLQVFEDKLLVVARQQYLSTNDDIPWYLRE